MPRDPLRALPERIGELWLEFCYLVETVGGERPSIMRDFERGEVVVSWDGVGAVVVVDDNAIGALVEACDRLKKRRREHDIQKSSR